MSTIVGIHGIANTFSGTAMLTDDWFKALHGGLEEAGGPMIHRTDLTVVAYGPLFRLDANGKERTPRGVAQNVRYFKTEADWERELLAEWWKAAAELSDENRKSGREHESGEDPHIQHPNFQGRARAPQFVQRALLQLTKSRFFRLVGPTMLISELRQVRLFLHDPAFKKAILERLLPVITPETKAVIGHSLGSVVAYEALCALSNWEVDTFISLGSPLGIPNVIFDALTPKQKDGRGIWPNVKRWVNIADRGDLVALDKDLAPFFGPVEDVLIHNGWKSHDVLRYLLAPETGHAVSRALGGGTQT